MSRGSFFYDDGPTFCAIFGGTGRTGRRERTGGVVLSFYRLFFGDSAGAGVGDCVRADGGCVGVGVGDVCDGAACGDCWVGAAGAVVISLSLAPTASTSFGVASCFPRVVMATILHTRGISACGWSEALNQISRDIAVTMRPTRGCSCVGRVANSKPKLRSAFCDSIKLVWPGP